jgi:hypothetical protein
MPLRPLIVVTGSIHVEGGDTHTVRQAAPKHSGSITINHTRKITQDRRQANVVSTGYMRRVARLRLLKTPYGSLVDPEKLPAVKELLTSATRDVAAFNAAHQEATARLTNCLLWEHLRGQRLAAVEGWILRGVSDKVVEVVEVAPALLAT